MQHFCFLKLFQCLSFGTLSVGSCIPLTPPYPSSVQGFVLFWVLSDTTSCSRLIFCILCGSPRIIYFCKEFSFLSLENGIRNQDLDTRSSHCCWGVIASKSSQMTKQGDMCVYSYQYLYTYL